MYGIEERCSPEKKNHSAQKEKPPSIEKKITPQSLRRKMLFSEEKRNGTAEKACAPRVHTIVLVGHRSL